MSERYEKARAIAEAAANRWDQFSDTAGVSWLAEQIDRAIAAEPLPTGGRALHRYEPHKKYPGCAVCGYAESERLMHPAVKNGERP